jgi:hypothetical protein
MAQRNTLAACTGCAPSLAPMRRQGPLGEACGRLAVRPRSRQMVGGVPRWFIVRPCCVWLAPAPRCSAEVLTPPSTPLKEYRSAVPVHQRSCNGPEPRVRAHCWGPVFPREVGLAGLLSVAAWRRVATRPGAVPAVRARGVALMGTHSTTFFHCFHCSVSDIKRVRHYGEHLSAAAAHGARNGCMTSRAAPGSVGPWSVIGRRSGSQQSVGLFRVPGANTCKRVRRCGAAISVTVLLDGMHAVSKSPSCHT